MTRSISFYLGALLLIAFSATATPCYEVIFKSYMYTHSSSVSTYCYNVVTGPSCSVPEVEIFTDCLNQFAAGQDQGFSASSSGFKMAVSLGPSSSKEICVKINGVVGKEAFPIADVANRISSNGLLDSPYCEIDECLLFPCQNNGVCTNGLGSRTCRCPAGFTGVNCETNVNDCANHLCRNGTCVDGVNSYTCSCTPGFSGDLCDSNINECESNPCKFGAPCIDGINSVTCICPVGRTGAFCQDVANFCSPNPCLNSGTCNTLATTFSCNCTNGFTGNRCQFVPSSSCASVSLQSSCYEPSTQTSTICLNVTTGAHPSCNFTSFGIYSDCSLPLSTSPSGISTFNDQGRRGIRWTLAGTYATQRTFCATYAGQVSVDKQDAVISFAQGNLLASTYTPFCEANECQSAPCLNQGTCINLTNSFKCICPPGFEGAQCSIPMAA